MTLTSIWWAFVATMARNALWRRMHMHKILMPSPPISVALGVGSAVGLPAGTRVSLRGHPHHRSASYSKTGGRARHCICLGSPGRRIAPPASVLHQDQETRAHGDELVSLWAGFHPGNSVHGEIFRVRYRQSLRQHRKTEPLTSPEMLSL
jgi:hypothetical protein